ncbi:hypothetical protein [Psychroserpens algicola]|uniref:hypothetical protein n=1 Tax=Psychroserpens algicola TaxID=1719034 RepID=UPI00195367F4|nr:hypothetical protein [Psychroserpens algicola]
MLNIEKQEVIQGCVVYQDYTDPNSFYCLPEEKAKIADDGKGIQYMVYTDNDIIEGDDPNFDNDESRVGGFLTLQVELGPSQDKFEAIKSELVSKYGDGVNLSLVPFKDGDVKLVMFGTDGSDENNTEDLKVTIAGSTKPSLNLRQTAVFSVRLSNKPAQAMWNMLQQKGQTQVSVIYDLSYLGVMKAYNLEIEVDFKATEDFWNHTFDLDASVKNDDVKIAASADIDVMIRALMSEGSIKVKETIYAQGESQTSLLANDPSGIELVKKLMGPTIFQATAIPTEDYSAAINETIADRVRDGEGGDADGPPGGDEQDDPPTTNDEDDTEEETDNTNTDDSGDGEEGDEGSVDGTDTDNDREDTEDGDEDETEDDDSGIDETEDEDTEDTGDSAEDQEGATGETDETSNDDQEPSDAITTPDTEDDDEDDDDDDDTEEDETDEAFDVDINVGYTLRRREISEQVKRKFTFNKSEAKTIKYHPNGPLSVAGTSFDTDTQLLLVKLGEGPFKEIELEVRASFDFDEYDITEAVVHLSYGYKGDEGDKTKRLHEHSLTLDKNNLSDKIKFFVDDYRTLSYDYYVEFIHKTGSIIGSPETKVTSQVFEDETKRDLSINMDTHSPLIPVEIQTGELQFEDEGIRSVQVFLAPKKGGNGRTTILKEGEATMKRYLIHPPTENQYDYFLRTEFFFKDEKLVFEEENLKDSQVIVDRPLARIFSITPNLAGSHDLIKQALIDIKYATADAEEKETTLNLTPEDPKKSFAVLVEEDDPRAWNGRSRFVLNDGRLLEGDWINYDTEQPLINLDNSGFRTLKVALLLGATTFSGKLVAIEVTLTSTDEDHPGSSVLFLNESTLEQTAIIPNVPVTITLNAAVKLFSDDGTQEELNFVVPPNSPQLMLPITTIN